MLKKFLPHGSGDPIFAKNYLVAAYDHNGHKRAGVTVLRGCPEQVAAVANSLPFVYKYTSGVIAWHPQDKPTHAQIETALDSYEKLAFAGFDKERYCWSAIRHDDADGSIHIHTFIARVDLKTGKSLNVAPPGWQKDFDAWRDAFNLEFGWARPDDPNRARALQPGIKSVINASQAQKKTLSKRQIPKRT